MKLSLLERIMISGLLPETQGRAIGRLVVELNAKLLPSAEEFQKFQIKEAGQFFLDKKKGPIQVPEGQILWDKEAEDAAGKQEIEIDKVLMTEIVKKLKELEDTKRLRTTKEWLDLYDRLVDGKEV